jgi:glutathione peroxidase
MKMILALGVVAVAALFSSRALADTAAPPPATQPVGPLDFTMKDIDGHDVNLAQYRGKVVMIVNVASKCGNTPQYDALEKMYEANKDKGFVILGFPANDFHSQEPGTDAEIKTFCTLKYNVSFPMFSKISVKGDDMAPLYQFLTSKDKDGEFGGPIDWNFAKFLVDRNGQVVARFKAKTKPTDPTVVAAVDAAIGK